MSYEQQQKSLLLPGKSCTRFIYSAQSGLVFLQRQENIITLSYLVEIKDWCKLCYVKFEVFLSSPEDNWMLQKCDTVEENLFYSNPENLHPERNLFMWK